MGGSTSLSASESRDSKTILGFLGLLLLGRCSFHSNSSSGACIWRSQWSEIRLRASIKIGELSQALFRDFTLVYTATLRTGSELRA
jgi:hypothetical protein